MNNSPFLSFPNFSVTWSLRTNTFQKKNRGAEFLYPLVPKNRQTPMGLGSTEGEEYPTVGRTQLGLLGHSFESVQRLVKNRVWSLACISYRKKGRDPEGPLDRRAAFCPR